MKTINLGFRIKDVVKSHSNFKLLFNDHRIKIALMYDGKYIYEYDYHHMVENSRINLIELNETKLAINATLSQKYQAYFMLCEGWKLYIFRRNLDILQRIHFDSKYTVGIHFIDKTDQMLLIGVDVIDLLSIKIDTNIRQAKYLSNIKFDLKKLKKTTFEEGLDWNKGYFITEGEYDFDNLLYIWGQKDLKVLGLFNGKAYYHYQGIGRKENVIYSFLLLQSYRYFVLGYQNGQLKVWKLSEGKTIIHTYDGHTRPVESLMHHQDPKLFWSASSDQSIRLWNLDQFTNVYTFQLTGIYRELNMLSYDKFMAEHDSNICLGTANNNRQLVNTLGTKVLFGIKQKEQAVILTLENNSGVCVWADSLREQAPVGVFYPPPKSKGILQILPSPYDDEEFLMLIESGELCLSRMERGTGVMTQMQKSEMIQDFEGHAIGQIACVLAFIDIVPNLFDVDFGRGGEFVEPKKLCCVGLSKGSVVFFSLLNLSIIYTRLSYHRDRIISVCGLRMKKSDTYCKYLISLCVEGYLKIITFDDKPECVMTLNSHKNINLMVGLNTKILFGTYKGQFQIFNHDFKTYSSDEGNEHDLPLLSIDIHKKFIITSSEDQKVKIWNRKKVLLLIFMIDYGLDGAWILNQNDIIIAHEGKLSLFPGRCYKIRIVDKNSYHRLQGIAFQDYYDQVGSNQTMSTKQNKTQSTEQEQQKEQEGIDKSGKRKRKQIKMQSHAINYVGGKVILPSIDQKKQTILIRGKVKDLEQETKQQLDESELIDWSDKKIKKEQMHKRYGSEQKKKMTNYHDWEAMEQYEANRKQRSTVMPAVPRMDNSLVQESLEISYQMDKSLKRKILTRRDITINRIFMQNIFD